VQVFEVTGVHIDVKQSTAKSILLWHLELASSGTYRCEVSTEAPSFETVTNYSTMLTIAPPDDKRLVSNGQDRQTIKPGEYPVTQIASNSNKLKTYKILVCVSLIATVVYN
jgi:hypothetical protein